MQEIDPNHYRNMLDVGKFYSSKCPGVDTLVKAAESEGFAQPWRWAGYYILCRSPTFNAYVDTVLRPYLSDEQIDMAVVSIATYLEILQRPQTLDY